MFVIPPDGFACKGRWWHTAETLRRGSPAFELRALPPQPNGRFSLLHVTDFHVVEPERRNEQPSPGPDGIPADYPTASKLKSKLLQFIKASPDAEFIIATGDLTNGGDERSLRAVARVFRSLEIPVYPVFGGHDGNVERKANGADQFNTALWTQWLAPPYYSWHWKGRHFVSFVSENTNYLDPVTRQMHENFIAEDLRLFGRSHPVTICSHKHPYPWNDSIFHRYRVDSWLHGHFHCNRVIQRRKITVYSTNPPAFGGLDTDVAPARLVRFSRGSPPRGIVVRTTNRTVAARVNRNSVIQTVWRSPVQRISHLATPCITPESIYCGVIDDEAGRAGGVVCINSDNGKLRWKTILNGSIQAPVAHADGVLIAVTHDGGVHALHAATGRLMWRKSLQENFDRWIYSPPIISDDLAIIGTTSLLVCLHLRSGRKRWAFRCPRKSSDAFGQFQSARVVGGRVFIAGYRTGSFLIDRSNGRLLHQNDDLLARYSSRVALNTNSYVIGDNSGALSSFDLATGQMQWRQQISRNMISSAFVPFCGGLIGGTPEGVVYCASESGEILARRSFGRDLDSFVGYRDRARSCPSTPCADGELVWVASGDGYINLLAGPKLRLLARQIVHDPIISGLCLGNDASVIGVTAGGCLACFALGKGGSTFRSWRIGGSLRWHKRAEC